MSNRGLGAELKVSKSMSWKNEQSSDFSMKVKIF